MKVCGVKRILAFSPASSEKIYFIWIGRHEQDITGVEHRRDDLLGVCNIMKKIC